MLFRSAFLLTRFSFVESKSDEVDVEVVAMAATSLDESSSSSLSISPVEYSSCLFKRTTFVCFLLLKFLLCHKRLLVVNL